MFFGPRGTGKTTVSKIFARNINCEKPNDGIACGKCDHCKVSFSKDCIDIIEIDAASNNGVDEIRELKNKISEIFDLKSIAESNYTYISNARQIALLKKCLEINMIQIIQHGLNHFWNSGSLFNTIQRTLFRFDQNSSTTS